MLMALLFVFGVMNLAWVALLAVLVLIEKVVPGGPRIAQVAGGAALAVGAISMTAFNDSGIGALTAWLQSPLA